MSTIYVSLVSDGKVIDCFNLPAVPRVGDSIYINYGGYIGDRRETFAGESLFSVEFLAHADKFDGTTWVVDSVRYAANYARDGAVSCYVSKKPG